MPKRDRGSIHTGVTAGFCLLLLVLLGALVYATAASHTARQMRAIQNSERNSQSTQERIKRRCGALDLPGMAECVYEEIKSAEDSRRAEDDLTAQQDMGDSAYYMLWVSVSSVAITALGLYYVRLTFAEAKETTRIALTQVNSERAWVTADGFNIALFEDPAAIGLARKWGVNFSVAWRNTGRSPGANFTAFVDSQKVTRGNPIPVFIPEDITEDRSFILGPNCAPVDTNPITISAEQIHLLQKGQIDIYVYSKATYHIFPDFAGKVHHTEVCYHVQWGGFERNVDGRLTDMPRLRASPEGRQNTAT